MTGRKTTSKGDGAMIMPKEVRAAIRDAMREQGVDVPSLAKHLDVNTDDLLDWLTGRQSIPAMVYVRGCRFLGLNPLMTWPPSLPIPGLYHWNQLEKSCDGISPHVAIVIAEQMVQRQVSPETLFDKIKKTVPDYLFELYTVKSVLDGLSNLQFLPLGFICNELNLNLQAISNLAGSESPDEVIDSHSLYLKRALVDAPAAPSKARKRKHAKRIFHPSHPSHAALTDALATATPEVEP